MSGDGSTGIQSVFRAVTQEIPAMFSSFVIPIPMKPFHDSFDLRDRTFLKTFVFISSGKAFVVLDVVLLAKLLEAREITTSVAHTLDNLDLRTGNNPFETLCKVPPISWQDIIATTVDQLSDLESSVASLRDVG